ncbi:MAG: hypothetical protein EXQ94_04645 [Alphaproteobacteria bacterium]|nr:hypothetical protein [Alphaproteobacteria bacterium]
MPAGVISNARSRRNRRHGVVAADVLRAFPGIPHAVLDGVGDIPRVLADFARAGVDLIVIDGGDGTVGRVLTAALVDGPFAAAPRFAILPSGTTNMTAGDVGLRGSNLAALLAGGPERAASRAALEVRCADAPPVLGFFLGAGALAWATAITRRRIESHGLAGTLSAVAGIGVTLVRCLAGGDDAQPRAGVAMRLGLDDEAPRDGRRFLLLATTLQHLVLGLDPFWGEGDGPLKLLTIAAPPAHVLAALPAVVRRRPWPWMAAAGYRASRARTMALAADGPVLLDGEVLPAGPIRVVATRPITFVRPG